MPKVSVIIPIYNGEQYLHQCLDSVKNQTLSDIEIICVDDGSTDKSLEILQEYQKNDERFQIRTQKNKYAGAARNLGKSNATGEYLIFWDCDDFFELNALEKLYEQATSVDADICVCSAKQYYENLGKAFTYPYIKMRQISEATFNRTTNEKYIHTFTNEAPWNKLFRREFVEKNNIDFQAIRNGNDVFFVECSLAMANRITTVNEALVYYRKNKPFGLVDSLDKSAKTPLQAWIDTANYLKEHDVFCEQSFANKATSSMLYILRNLKTQDAFIETVDFLKSEGLQALHIKPQEEGYYYVSDHNILIEKMINSSVQDFQTALAYWTFTKQNEASSKNWELRKNKEDIRAKNRELSKAKKELQLSLKDLRQEYRQLKQERNSINSENKAIKKENTRLSKDISKASKQNEKLSNKNEKLSNKNENLNNELTSIKNSYSYKISLAITWVPRKIKRLFKKNP